MRSARKKKKDSEKINKLQNNRREKETNHDFVSLKRHHDHVSLANKKGLGGGGHGTQLSVISKSIESPKDRMEY